MKNLFKKLNPIMAIALSFVILTGGVAYAAYTFKYPTIVTDTSLVGRTYLPVLLGYSGQDLLNAGKINADALDTNMQIAASSIKYMFSTDEVTAVIPNLTAGGKSTLDLYTGYTPNQTNFPIIPGVGGYGTVVDAANLEGAGNFEHTYDGYVDTTVGIEFGAGILPCLLVEEIELTTPAPSVTFDDILTKVAYIDSVLGTTTRHLVLYVNAASEDAVAKRAVEIVINDKTIPKYNHQTLTGENIASDADFQTKLNAMFEYPGGTDYPFAVPGATYPNSYGGGAILFPHAFTSNYKSCIAYGGAVEDYVNVVTGRFGTTPAIDSFELSLDTGNFKAGSVFQLCVVDERYLVEEESNDTVDFLPVFDNITSGGHDLVIIGYPRSDAVAVEDEILIELNDDAVAVNYPAQQLDGRANVTTAVQVNQEVGISTGESVTAKQFGAFFLELSQYAEATNYPQYLTLSGYQESTGATSDSEVRIMSGQWTDASAITKIELYPNVGVNFKLGSLFSLYRVPKYLIDRQELAVPAASITIDLTDYQDYEAVQINVYGRSDLAALSENVYISFNADTTIANYDTQTLDGTGVVATAVRSAASRTVLAVTAANEVATEFGGGVITLPQYSRYDRHKSYYVIDGLNDNSVFLRSCRWEYPQPITSIVLTLAGANNFDVGTIVEAIGVIPNNKSDDKCLALKPGAFNLSIVTVGQITATIHEETYYDTVIPNGVGNETNIAILFGAATHWQACSTDDGNASYVGTTTGAVERDTYTASAPAPLGDSTINSVTVYMKCRDDAAGATAMTAVRTHGTTYDGAVEALTPVYVEYATLYDKNPNTGFEWTWDEVEDMEIGVSLAGIPAVDGAYCTYVYAVVDYTVKPVSVSAQWYDAGDYQIIIDTDDSKLYIYIDGVLEDWAWLP